MDSNSVMGQQIQKDIEETARLRSLMNPPPPEEFAAIPVPDGTLTGGTTTEVATAEEAHEGEEHAEG